MIFFLQWNDRPTGEQPGKSRLKLTQPSKAGVWAELGKKGLSVVWPQVEIQQSQGEKFDMRQTG